MIYIWYLDRHWLDSVPAVQLPLAAGLQLLKHAQSIIEVCRTKQLRCDERPHVLAFFGWLQVMLTSNVQPAGSSYDCEAWKFDRDGAFGISVSSGRNCTNGYCIWPGLTRIGRSRRAHNWFRAGWILELGEGQTEIQRCDMWKARCRAVMTYPAVKHGHGKSWIDLNDIFPQLTFPFHTWRTVKSLQSMTFRTKASIGCSDFRSHGTTQGWSDAKKSYCCAMAGKGQGRWRAVNPHEYIQYVSVYVYVHTYHRYTDIHIIYAYIYIHYARHTYIYIYTCYTHHMYMYICIYTYILYYI